MSISPIPIVLVTGHAEPELVERAASVGILSYLLKPVSQRKLDAAIQVARARFAEFQALHAQVRSLAEALEIRKLVEQAKGILMQRLRVSEPEAFRKLQRRASGEHTSLRQIAEAVREADRFYRDLEAEDA